MVMNITDLGRVLTAMVAAIEDDRLKRMLRAGAAKCAEIAQEQLADAPQPVEASKPEWIKHNSDKRPVPTSAFIEVELINGSRETGYAAYFKWGYPYDVATRINRYRIIDRPEQTG